MKPTRSTVRRATLVLWLGLATTTGLQGADPSKDRSDWGNLKQLSSGQQIEVVLNDAKSYRGRFKSVSQDILIVRSETGEQSFDRNSVLQVSAKAGSHRLRNAILGGVIGIAAGAGIGAATGKSCTNCFKKINEAVGAGAGAIIGLGASAGVGAALPAAAWRTVYRVQ